MKEFNLDDAKNGKKVCTKDGHAARIICFDAKRSCYPIIALVENKGEEVVISYNLDGSYCNNENDELDLFMKPEKHEGFVWTDGKNACAYIYHSKKEALAHKVSGEYYLAKIEWEE